MGVWTPGPGATFGDDTFTGDETGERANGLAGADFLNGDGGDDTLTGGKSNDADALSAACRRWSAAD